nr:adenylate cyclase type 4-like [Meriones unguiculatus]
MKRKYSPHPHRVCFRQEKAFSPQWSLDRSRTPRGLDDELDTGDAKFFQVIEQLNSQKQWKQSKDFNLLTLYFREKEMEKQVGQKNTKRFPDLALAPEKA